MPHGTPCDGLRAAHGARMILMVLGMAGALARPALGLIEGGAGNSPLSAPGLPEGALPILNHPARIAWWQGPPFGGGQWHAECRGDTQALNAALRDFGGLDVKRKRVIVRDGVGYSFWLNPNHEPEKRAQAKVDWVFMVWQTSSWERLRTLPSDLRHAGLGGADQSPPSELHVYTGGNVRWAEVTVPKGIEVVDERLEAHGFGLTDGHVMEGKVVDLTTKRPVPARVRLERIEPQPKGGYQYAQALRTTADAQGRWVLKTIPAGWYRVVVEADGYVPRVVGYTRAANQPRWQSQDGGLARRASVSGLITDDAGRPLADVEVRLADVTVADERYEAPGDYKARSGEDGRFRLEPVPVGKASVHVRKSGYYRPGLGQPITTPDENVTLSMSRSASLRVTVDFAAAERPAAYIVELEPEGGSKVGSWGGSAHIDAKNQYLFENVPPGRYVLKGHPNPSSADQQSQPLTIELKGGEAKEVTLPAK